MFVVSIKSLVYGKGCLSVHEDLKKNPEYPQHIPVVSVLGEHTTVQMCFRWHDWDIFSV